MDMAAAPDRAAYGIWWLGMVEAALALFFGISALFWPGLTLLALVYLFSGFVLGLGIIYLISGLASMKRQSSWWVAVLLGLAGIGGGVYLLTHTDVSLRTFILLVGLLLIARGIMDIARIFMDPMSRYAKVFFGILGVAAIVAGLFVMFRPVAAGVTFVWALGLYAIIMGSISMVIALELRSLLALRVPEAPAKGPYRRNRGKKLRTQTT